MLNLPRELQGNEMIQEGPHWIQIEVTTFCNMHCTYCDLTFSNSPASHFPLELAAPCVRNLSSLRTVLLQGFGEPLLYKFMNDLIAVVRRYQPTVSIQTVTNGMIKVKHVANFLPYLDVLYVSFDSLDPTYWEKIRVGGDPLTIRDNIRKFREVHPNLFIVVNCVVSMANVDELNEVLDFCAEEHYDGLQLIPLFHFDTGYAQKENCVSDRNYMFSVAEKLYERGRALGVTVYHPYAYKLESQLCLWPHNGVYVLVDGKVTPCCVMSQPTDISFGSLKNESLKSIWLSPKALEFRETYVESKVCSDCLQRGFPGIWNNANPLPLMVRC